MKRTLLSILVMAFHATASVAATDSIPNGGFERWFTTGWFDYPAEWITNNHQLLAPGVTKDLNPHSGNLAMNLTNLNIVPEADCYFLISSNHINVGGYCKNELFNNDSTIFTVRIYYQSVEVDSGITVFYGGIINQYAPFFVNLTQGGSLADSCTISILGGENNMSSISFDDLQFDFLQNIKMPDKNDFVICSNPSNTNTIVFQSGISGNFHMSIFDITGRVANEGNLELVKGIYSIQADLPAGLYLLTLKSGEYSIVRRLLKL